MNKGSEAPVLLITFNRPDYTKAVFEQIREAKIAKLYVFNDGARENNQQDAAARLAIQGMLQEIDWPCELSTYFPDKNLGCAIGVSSAISWIFRHEEMAIILEDDTVPAKAFFKYCNEMLDRYKHDTRVWMISGNNYNEEYKLSASYTFSRSAIHIWGWATWKRCWDHYNITLDVWPSFTQSGGFRNVFNSKSEIKFWTKRYEHLYSNRTITTTKTWDYQYVLSLLINGGLCIVPQKNLVTNIGHTGEHTQGVHHFHNRPVDEHFKIDTHPSFILPNAGYDEHHIKYSWKVRKTYATRIYRKLRNIIKK